MPGQDHYWSQAAAFYEQEFIDPYRADVRHNPLHHILSRLAKRGNKVVGDLGCGLGPLLPFLAQHFETVYAVDFAEGMLERARQQVRDKANVHFVQASMMDLHALPEALDVAVAVNSLVMPSPEELDQSVREIVRRLKPGGTFLGIVPAMDAVHYYTMLLVDRARAAGQPVAAVRRNAAEHCEHEAYDFAFGQFRFRGLEQHFWQPFEVHHRFALAGLRLRQLKKVFLSWKQFAGWKELRDQPPPWDWFFLRDPRDIGRLRLGTRVC